MDEERFPTFRRIGHAIGCFFQNPLGAMRATGCWLAPIVRRVGLVLLVLFVLAAIPWTYFNIKWGLELEARLAELKAQGMPLTPAEAAPKPVPDSQNAAVLYQEVFKVQFPPAGPIFGEGAMGGLSKDDRNVFPSYLKEPTPELESQVRTLLTRPQVQQALDTLRQASTRPYSVFPVKWEQGAAALYPHMGMFRAATYIIAAKALLLADEGRVKEALDWCRVSLRMSQHAASEPTVVAQLVATAMQAITFDAVKQVVSATDVQPALAHKFEEYLRQINLYETFTAGMIGERALGRWFFDHVAQPDFFDNIGLRRTDRPVPLRLYASWLGSPVQKLDQLTYLTYMGGVIEASKLPYREGEDQLEAQRKAIGRLPTYLVVTKLLFPVFTRANAKRDEAVANIGMCRTVLALKAYKYEYGAYPQSLGELQETLDWELPEDPFSGRDFVYQRQGEGFILYSIGPDFEDDGGVPLKYRHRREPRGYDGDIVWQCSR